MIAGTPSRDGLHTVSGTAYSRHCLAPQRVAQHFILMPAYDATNFTQQAPLANRYYFF